MTRRFAALLATLALLLTAGVFVPGRVAGQQQPPAGQGQGGRQQRQAQARDRAQMPQGTAIIAGRVIAADTGRPIKRARVTVSGGNGRQARSTSTDEQGHFQIGDLAGGTYTIAATRSGFVNAVYGQKRPLQPGTPVDLADGQQLTNIDLRLIRGGVITGRIVDEDGDPLARALVTVQRYQYVNGERQLTPAGADQSDDRGVYRVFGLPPGEYYVSANAASLLEILGRGIPALAGLAGGGAAQGGRGGGRGAFFGAPAPDDPEPTGYAPTYYPGVISAAEAAKVPVGPGQEITGVDFQVQLVATATVSGLVTGADGPVPVMLIPGDAGGMVRAEILRGSAAADGTFSIPNVPPGHYTAASRSGGRWDDPKMGSVPLTVSGQNVSGVTIALVDGVTVSGNITVESSGTPAPADYSVFRIDVPDVEPLPLPGGPGPGGGGPNAAGGRAEKNGTFSIANLFPGRHYIRVTGQGNWTLKSVSIGARDVTDQAIELRPDQDVDNVTVVLTDRATDLSGTVRDGIGNPVANVTVIAFSTDPQYWRAQSRRIQAVHTSATGAYRMHGLPPGDYQIIAVDDVETGEWYDPAYLDKIKDGAKSVSLEEGDKKTVDVRGPG